jgi:SOS-response transcriptional repressor LexA
MTSPPTPQQAKVLSTARAMYRAADGVPPTQQAVADRLGLSKPTVHGHAQELRRKGWLVAGEKRLVPVGMSELRPSRDLVTRTMTALSVAGALAAGERVGSTDEERASTRATGRSWIHTIGI